jgi:hypothetical protein
MVNRHWLRAHPYLNTHSSNALALIVVYLACNVATNACFKRSAFTSTWVACLKWKVASLMTVVMPRRWLRTLLAVADVTLVPHRAEVCVR